MSCCLVGAAVFLISACSDRNYQRKEVAESGVEASINNEESSLIEYIVVIKANANIASAISSFKKYEAQLIGDLKKNLYQIGLKKDPGIEQLRKDVEGSDLIDYIQPNFTYTTQ